MPSNLSFLCDLQIIRKTIYIYCTSEYEHHYKIFYIKIAIFLLFQLFDYWAVNSFLKDWTGNVNRFRGFLVPRPDWIKVLYLFWALGLHRLNLKKFKNLKNLKKIQNFHKTCSHHVHLCWSLLSQKNQTLMNDWGNSITMSMRPYSDL